LRGRAALGGAAAALLVLAQVVAQRSQPWVQDLRLFLLIELVSVGLYAVAVFAFRVCHGTRALVLVLVPALVMRAVLLATSPELSEDIARYLWEGRVSHAGFNPLALAPDDARLASLRDDVYERVTRKDIPSVYPPLAQVVFRVAAVLQLGDRGLRLLVLAAELCGMGVLALLLRRLRLPEGRLSVYALHPVVALELASSGHVDGLALPFFVLALAGLIAGRSIGAGIQVALAALAKLQAACIAPLLLIMRRGVWASILAAVLVIAAYLPVAQTGFLAGLGRYGAEWSFNGAAFGAVDQLAVFLRTQLVEYANRERGAWGAIAYHVDPRVLSRALLVLVWVVAAIGILRVRASIQSKAIALCASTLLLSPTVHPWYCVPLVAALTLRPVAPLLLLTGSLVLSYEILPRYAATGLWEERHWVRVAEYAPSLAWLSAVLLAQSRRDPSQVSGDATGRGGGESHAPGQDAA
jgi:hypothetical protein